MSITTGTLTVKINKFPPPEALNHDVQCDTMSQNTDHSSTTSTIKFVITITNNTTETISSAYFYVLRMP